MLQKISWGDYWLTVGVIAAIYELAVIALFFRKDIVLLVTGKLPTQKRQVPGINSEVKKSFQSQTSIRNDVAIEKENEAIMPQVHEVMIELKNFIQDVAERSFIKEEVIMGLQITLRDHKNLAGTIFQKSINDFIAAECAENCSIHLSEEELRGLWF